PKTFPDCGSALPRTWIAGGLPACCSRAILPRMLVCTRPLFVRHYSCSDLPAAAEVFPSPFAHRPVPFALCRSALLLLGTEAVRAGLPGSARQSFPRPNRLSSGAQIPAAAPPPVIPKPDVLEPKFPTMPHHITRRNRL